MKNTLVLLTLSILLACGGGGTKVTDPVTPPAPKSYGIFRNLVPKPAAAPALKASTAQFATAASVTMTSRQNHRAIQMLNGKVLLVGGDIDVAHPSMDIYDPATESFTKSAAVPSCARMNNVGSGTNYSAFSLVNLPDGNVMIYGGVHNDFVTSGSWEIYNPLTDTLSVHSLDYAFGPVNSMYYIGNNRVMVFFTTSGVRVADLADPDAKTLELISPETPVVTNGTTLQDNSGDIWVVGGLGPNPYSPVSQPNIYRYHPSTNTWETMHSLLTSRSNASVTLLPGNRIGIYGGDHIVFTNPGQTDPTSPVTSTRLTSVEVYDITTNAVTGSSDLVGSRTLSEAILLQTGYTLIAGGLDNTGATMNTELVHNASLNISGSTGTMLHARHSHCVTPLTNGLVLITGGNNDSGEPVFQSAELYDPLARLYINYKSEEMVVNTTLQLSTTYTAGVDWTLMDNTSTYASIDANGLLTATGVGAVEVKATAKDDSTLTAIIRIKIIPE